MGGNFFSRGFTLLPKRRKRGSYYSRTRIGILGCSDVRGFTRAARCSSSDSEPCDILHYCVPSVGADIIARHVNANAAFFLILYALRITEEPAVRERERARELPGVFHTQHVVQSLQCVICNGPPLRVARMNSAFAFDI